MGKHTGSQCLVCAQKLRDDDDVVVCPECGTPYHRACWQKSGSCVNIPLHETGGTFQSHVAEEEESLQRICPNCGTSNTPTAQRCQNCGISLQDPLQTPSWQAQDDTVPPQRETFRERLEQTAERMGTNDPYYGMNQEETLGGERLGDVADFVQQNIIYYLPKFQRFEKTGRRVSINFPCLLFPQLYFANRKMWPLAMICVGVLALLQLPQMAMAMLSALPDLISSFQDTGNDMNHMFAAMYPDMQGQLQTMLDRLESWETTFYNAAVVCNYLEICAKIVFGILGNWIYYRFVLRRVHRVRLENLPDTTCRDRLRMQGGTNGWLIVGMIVLEYVFLFVLMAILFSIFLMG